MPHEHRALTPDVRGFYALSSELARVEDVLDALPVPWYVTDAEDRITQASPAFRRLVDAKDVTGMLARTVYKDEAQRARLIAAAEKAAGGEADALVTLANGVHAEDRVRVRGAGGERRVVGVLRDVTPEVEFERDLDRAARDAASANRSLRSHVRALDVLTYGIGHDLRTPLRGILAHMDALEEDLGEQDALGDDVPEHVQAVRRACGDMERMLTGLLAFARLRGEAVGEADASSVLDDVLQALEEPVRKKGVQVDAAELPLVPASAEYLRVVLQNLVGNAVKYADGSPPRVRVHAERTADAWEFTVADSGPGVPAGLRERVFDVFYRAPGTNGEGSGVGLAVARVATESWGGHIWVDEAPEGGAAFHFTIPDADG